MSEAADHPTPAPGAPCWVSLPVRGLAAAQEFYGGLFGWEFESGPGGLGPYVRAYVKGEPVAGMSERQAGTDQLRVTWLPFWASGDADATAADIRDHGGTVAVGPVEWEAEGRAMIASDTAGAAFGVWEGTRRFGWRVAEVGVTGIPVWYELIVREAWSAEAFYREVFGHDPLAEASAPDYLTLRLEGQPIADVLGVGDRLSRDRGPHWKTYFAVEDPDAAVSTAVRLGGRTVRPPHESPYGRTATLADPEGAHFSVISRRLL